MLFCVDAVAGGTRRARKLTEWNCGQARHASLHSHTWPIHFAHPLPKLSTQTLHNKSRYGFFCDLNMHHL